MRNQKELSIEERPIEKLIGKKGSFTRRRIDLLNGDVLPKTEEERRFVLFHSGNFPPSPPPNFFPGELEKSTPSSLDDFQKKAKEVGDIFEKRGRPLGGAKDD